MLTFLHSQAFISFFFRQPKQKKPTPTQVVNPKKRSKQAGPPIDDATGDNDFNVLEPDDTERELLDELADLDGVEDQAKVTNDNEKVSGFRTQAVEKARSLGIILSEEEAKTALSLFPKVSTLSLIQSLLTILQVAGLAQRVHDSSALQAKFEVLIGAESQMRALVRRVITRWNSDFDCLQSHIALKHAVNTLITIDLSLQKYRLDEKQWELALVLADQLQVW